MQRRPRDVLDTGSRPGSSSEACTRSSPRAAYCIHFLGLARGQAMGPAFKQLRCVEQLPRGANFKRAKVLWELGLHLAGNPLIPYGGDRDMCITVGSGSGESFRPALKLATGSAILAHAVVKGDIDMAFVNPSAMLTQEYRGGGGLPG